MSTNFYSGFSYPIAPRLKGSKLLKRRILQIKALLFSKQYASRQALMNGVKNYYQQSSEIKFYQAYSSFGLHENEQEVLQAILNDAGAKTLNSLVIGCGAGRECFALNREKSILSVLGVDQCSQMIATAKQHPDQRGVKFTNQGLEAISQKFHLIWVTAILESHIQGKANRIIFYKQLHNHLSPNGKVIMTPLIRPLHWRHPHYWASKILKWRWSRNRGHWEQGDTLVSHMGAHSINKNFVFSHFYPSKEHFIEELKMAGFSSFQEHPQESWIIQ